MTGTLEVRGLSHWYARTQREVLRDLDLTFRAGTVTALTGQSGSGKSTLLFAIGLLLRPRRGSILLDGRDLTAEAEHRQAAARATSIGFVFQDAVLDPSRTLLDSVVEPAVYADRDRATAIRRARMLAAELHVDDVLDHRPGQASGGQAQRAALCRALINEPRLLLADEPTGNLDAANAHVVLSRLVREARERDRFVLIATHDPNVVGLADRVIDLQQRSVQ